MFPKVAILGSAQTKHESSKRDLHITQMIYQTVKAALKNAGMENDQIDTVVSASCDVLDGISIGNCFTCEAMGAFMKEETRVEDDGIFAAIYAYMRIMAGQFDTALVLAYSKGSQVPPYYYSGLSCDPYYQRPLGLETDSLAALQCRTYMEAFNVSEADIASVSVKNRKNGANNPLALLQEERTLDQILDSPYVCDPLRKEMIFPQTDGACAIILGNEKIAAKSKNPPAWIRGAGFCTDSYYPGYRDLSRVKSAQQAASTTYEMAGVKNPLNDFDVAEISAPYAHQELMLTESLGFCSPGEGNVLLKASATDWSGPLPVNPSGGALCANPIIGTGLIRLAETALQVTGQAGKRQIDDARLGLAHGASGQCLQSNGLMVVSGE
jgi:acetyl-CoA C-acetyltransferase